MKLKFSSKGNNKTYQGGNECNPHKKIEPSKHVIEGFFPILSFRRGYDIFAEGLGKTCDIRRFKADCRRGGEPLVNYVDRNSVNVNLANEISYVCRRLRGFFVQ
jgi:hypothetical protein